MRKTRRCPNHQLTYEQVSHDSNLSVGQSAPSRSAAKAEDDYGLKFGLGVGVGFPRFDLRPDFGGGGVLPRGPFGLSLVNPRGFGVGSFTGVEPLRGFRPCGGGVCCMPGMKVRGVGCG